MKTFSPLQTALAMGAQNARDAGFDGLASAFVQALKRDMGVSEATSEAPKRLGMARNGGKHRVYGSFRLTEADECAMENVEMPPETVRSDSLRDRFPFNDCDQFQ